MPSVTAPGAGGTTITEVFGNTNTAPNFLLATQIANALAAASKAGNLNITTVSGNPVPTPPANPGGIDELIITAGGDYTVPAGSAGSPDYVVVLDTTAAVTIHGSPNNSIWGGSGPLTIVDPATITIAEGAGDASATLTGAGDVLAGNTHNDTLAAAGSNQSIAGGIGTNLLLALGANDTISAQGAGDTLIGGPSSSTFVIASTATKELMAGSFGPLTVTDGGTGDTLVGGIGAINATLTGSNGSVFGGLGKLTVTDSGTNDTVWAGSGAASISAPTSAANFHGGTGQFDFVGGTGNSSIFGGSGNGTVLGGTGASTIFGGAGGSIDYVNITGGSLFYAAQPGGNQTVDASLSKADNFLYTGQASGNNEIIGGPGNDLLTAGAGSDTLTGGGGANGFYFWAVNGGAFSHTVITDFSTIDYVTLGNYGPGAPAAAIASATVANGSTTITLSDQTKITFLGMTNPAALNGHINST